MNLHSRIQQLTINESYLVENHSSHFSSWIFESILNTHVVIRINELHSWNPRDIVYGGEWQRSSFTDFPPDSHDSLIDFRMPNHYYFGGFDQSKIWNNWCYWGVVGLLINGLIVVLLWIRKMRTGWYTYRVGMTFSAIHGVMIALLGILSCLVWRNSSFLEKLTFFQVHLFNYQNYILVIYGPIAYLPRVFIFWSIFL